MRTDEHLTVQELRAVVEVAEQGSFARAADALWVSRATMSTQVRTVERQLGVRLFERTTRRVDLTPAGAVFVDRARRLLVELALMREAVREADVQPQGTIRLGLPAGVVTSRIWQVLSAFRRDHPLIELTFNETTIDDLVHLVRKGELDISIAAWPEGQSPTGVATAVLARRATGVAVAPDHELTKLSRVRAADLDQVPLVAFVKGFALRAITEDFCARAGLRPTVALQTSVDETVTGLLQARVGYSITTLERASADGLTVLPTQIPCLDRILGLTWAAYTPLPPAVSLLRDRILEAFPESTDPPSRGTRYPDSTAPPPVKPGTAGSRADGALWQTHADKPAPDAPGGLG